MGMKGFNAPNSACHNQTALATSPQPHSQTAVCPDRKNPRQPGPHSHPPPRDSPTPTYWQVALRLVGFEGPSVLHVIQAGGLAATLLFIPEAKDQAEMYH